MRNKSNIEFLKKEPMVFDSLDIGHSVGILVNH